MSIADVLAGRVAWHVACADCFDFAAIIPDGAVNLLFLDPPYNMGKAEWDTFPSRADFLAFIGRVLDVSRRILAPNGSLYLCTATEVSAAVETLIGERFAVLNSIHWRKPEGATKAEMSDKDTCRRYFPASERVVFAEQPQSWSNAIAAARMSRGLSRQDVSESVVGTRSGACWNWEAGIRFPEPHHWERLRLLFPEIGGYSTEREAFEALRRPFAVSAAVPYTDCWTYQTVAGQDGKHPCEKPADMLRDVIAASSRPGDLVCELFAGSCVGGEQAVLAGRRYLGCDADPEWGERRGPPRIRRAEVAPERAGRPLKGAKPASERQPELFDGAA